MARLLNLNILPFRFGSAFLPCLITFIQDFSFQFAMKHPDLHCFVTNNIPMVHCCQSPLQGPAIASSTSEPYTAAPGTIVHQRWQSSPSRKRSYYLNLSHLAACISSAELSRVIGVTGLFVPDWQALCYTIYVYGYIVFTWS